MAAPKDGTQKDPKAAAKKTPAAKKTSAAKSTSSAKKTSAAKSASSLKRTSAAKGTAAEKKTAAGKTAAGTAAAKTAAAKKTPARTAENPPVMTAAQPLQAPGALEGAKAPDALALADFMAPENFYNRELSWLQFDYRCLSEARDTKIVPLFERLKFLAITASNLDEFFMVRIASLKDQENAGYKGVDIAGMTPKMQLDALSEAVHGFVREQYTTYNRSLLPALMKAGLEVVRSHEALTKEQSHFLDSYFEEVIYPVLTPMALDSSRPFPLVRNRSLNIGALITAKEDGDRLKKGKKKKTAHDFATVQVPSVLPRIVALPDAPDGHKVVILLEEVIKRYISVLFQHYDVECTCTYRIMRNADLSIDEEEAEDLLIEIQKQLKQRQWGEVIRLEIEESADKRLLRILKKELEIEEDGIYYIPGPLDLTFCMKMYGLPGFDDYKTPAYTPAPVPAFESEPDVFAAIRKKDILVHHPYMTFDPVVNFVRQAARDPEVLAIKQTLYRVSGNSPIISALAQAAESGKQVTVLVELKARFDEEHNIAWAKMLEKAGCHVIYGLLGLKVHSKITMVIRMEEDGIRRYVHLGTGNYNDSTARLYTDLGIFTCDEATGRDATSVFNMLSGYSEPDRWYKLLVAPLWMKNAFLKMIRRETRNALEGKPAFIRAKMNSLCEPAVIAALYEASCAGVQIDLLVRGICCLKAGKPGVSENIRVRSIVGNFLEHARIFWFHNGGDDELFMGSADWMPRNLDRRVEIVFPVEQEDIKEEVKRILTVEFEDNVKAHILMPDGTYEKIDKRGKTLVDSQEQFMKDAWAKIPSKKSGMQGRHFTPAEPLDN